MKQYEKDEYQANLDSEKATIAEIKKTYEDALEQVDEKIRVLTTRTDVENMPTIIYQKKYQEQIKAQLEDILGKLQEEQYKTVDDYLNNCYSESFLRTMYSLNQQDIPFVWPIDQEAAKKAVVLDSMISGGLYEHMGVDVKNFKKSISSEISRGIASSLSYSEIARNLNNASKVPISNASRIVRTEGHRIQNQAKLDTMNEAKKKGADVVKQWDSTMDGKTRSTHRQLDGQIREIDEDFEVGGMKASAPGMFGDPAEDCNCRCTALTRARWALGDGFTKMDNFSKQLVSFESADDYEQFKKDYWSDENVKYMKYVADKEEKYGTKNFEQLLEAMTDREYNTYSILLSENPLFSRNSKSVQNGLKKKNNKGTLAKNGKSSKISFKEATTIEEAKKYAKDTLKLYTADYDKFNIDCANMINKELTNIYNVFGNISDSGYLVGVSLYPKKTDWYAAYSPGFREIFVKNVSAKTSIKSMAKNAKEQFKSGFWSTDNAEHAIRHETGHAIQHWLTDNNPDKLKKISDIRDGIIKKCGITNWDINDTSEHMQAAGSYLSYYALRNDGEFIAESVAEYMTGNPRKTAKKVVDLLLKGK